MTVRAVRIDFNCDLGEGCGNDAAIVPLISSASIACGGHAGDADTMRETLELCLRYGVAIGAHPGFEDRAGFGRQHQPISPDQARALITRQLARLAAVAEAVGARIAHVKPHGALYNLAARERRIADAIADAVAEFDPNLRLYGLAGSHATDAASTRGLHAVHEAFAERRYRADGSLTARNLPGAVLASPQEALAQTRSLLHTGTVIADDGSRVAVRADSLCLHGDRTDAVAFARTLRDALEADGVAILPP